jgi:hypothetical protein
MGESMWRRDEWWNEAIAEVVFSRELDGAPVPLDLDDDEIDEIVERTGPAATYLVRRLSCAVKSVPGLVGAAEIRSPLDRVDAPRRSESIDPPPSLVLLALPTTIATVHHSDSEAANNHCGQRAQLLTFGREPTDRYRNAQRRSTKGTPRERGVVAAGDSTDCAYPPTGGATRRMSRHPRNLVGEWFADPRTGGFPASGGG